ncbi:multidrug resistance protein 1-like protein, partial [Dinothrombium tinctorium]
EVCVDGVNVEHLNLCWLRSKIGFVQQEPTLFSYSILENIAYGDNSRSIPMEEIIEAAKKANIHNFIENLPQGYATNVGDKGSQLSGGQKQRIAIARALIRNPSILLLDEATSALDSESEKIVQEALDEAMKGRTSLVIAHRLSTIQNADKIIVLKDGKVIEEGNHQTLLAKRGAYFELLNRQIAKISARIDAKMSVDFDEENNNEVEEEKTETEAVSIFEIFQFATIKDKIMMLIGFVNSILMGCSFPMMIIFYGNLIDSFVIYQQSLMFFKSNETNSSNTTADIEEKFRKDSLENSLALCGIAIGMFFISYLMVLCFGLSAKNQTQRIRLKFFESVLRQDMSWFDTKGSKDFASKVTTDLLKIETGIGEKIGLCVFFISSSLSSIGVAFYYGWKLTLVLLAIAPVIAITNGITAKIQTTMSIKESQAYAKAAAIAEEVLSSIRTVYAFGGQEKEVKRYSNSLIGAKSSGIKRSFATGFSMGFLWFGMFASYSFGFWYGIKLILNNEYTAKKLMVVFMNILIGAYLFGQASPHLEAFSIARGAAKGIYDIINTVPKIRKNSNFGQRIHQMQGKIEFDGVFFTYPSRPDSLILQGFNLTINPGETVAIVGSSGCGKSTVIQLLQRFYDPTYGRILVDGKNIKELNVGWFRDQIGTVGQEPSLFATTISENIKLGNLSANEEDIETAAVDANAHDFIIKLPLKYETIIGERGAQLSGGQKQRIAIARALVKKPKILLLDEATSALDLESEAVVQAALERASVGRTTIIIAHRLSTVQSADKIVAVDKGRVVEIGTHQELMERKGLYYNLVSRQQRSEEEQEDVLVRETQIQRMRALSLKPMFFEKSTSTTELNVDEEEKIQSRGMREVLKLVFRYKILLLIGCTAAAVCGVAMPIYSLIFGEILGTLSDRKKLENDRSYLSLLFLLLGVVYCIASIMQNYSFGVIAERVTMKLRIMVFSAYLQQEPSFFDDHNNSVGALCSRLSADASAVHGAGGSRISILCQAISTLIIVIVLAMVYNWKLGLVSLAVIPLQLISAIAEVLSTRQSIEGDTKASEESTKIAIESLNNIRTVVSLRLENHFYFKFKNALDKSDRKAAFKCHVRGLVLGFSQCVPSLAYSVTMFYGSRLVIDGEIFYGDVFKVVEGTMYGAMILGQSLAFASDFRKGKTAAKNIYKFLAQKARYDLNIGKILSSFDAKITFSSVYFSYPSRPDVQVLNDLSMKIDKGQTVALVGGSGCGKSTCIQLIERFYDCDLGEVCVDGVNVEHLNLCWLRSKIGFVQQEPTLFSYSILENIAYGDNSRSIPMEEIIEAAKKANIHNFIENLPQGYATNVGDKGSQLSGGQKQRIAIARALIRNPSILLLDEATSALDSESEKIVQEALDEAMKGRTSLVIAHRLSTIQNADKIIVLKDGKVIEEGNHQTLLAKRGAYFEL